MMDRIGSNPGLAGAFGLPVNVSTDSKPAPSSVMNTASEEDTFTLQTPQQEDMVPPDPPQPISTGNNGTTTFEAQAEKVARMLQPATPKIILALGTVALSLGSAFGKLSDSVLYILAPPASDSDKTET